MSNNILVATDKEANLPIIKVRGEIDIYTCSQLREALSKTIEESTQHLILDLEELQYIDSTGLGTIAHSAQIIEGKNGTIYILCNKPQIKKIFEVSGLPKKNIELYENKIDLNAMFESKKGTS